MTKLYRYVYQSELRGFCLCGNYPKVFNSGRLLFATEPPDTGPGVLGTLNRCLNDAEAEKVYTLNWDLRLNGQSLVMSAAAVSVLCLELLS